MNQEIYQAIRNRILFLEYEPGQILNEQQLAKTFKVSRTPLREVLSRLEWEHLVRILPRTGTMIAEIELNKIMNVFQIRLGIEEMVGQLAAENFGNARIERLEQLRLACAGLKDHRNRRALTDIEFELRGLFHEAAGNPFLTEMSERLYAITFRLWYLNMDRGDWQKEVRSVEEDLEALPEIMMKGDPVEVGRVRHDQLMRHLERIRSKFLGLTQSENLVEPVGQGS
jgi:DNA-binding GntR family transcriptional regulator